MTQNTEPDTAPSAADTTPFRRIVVGVDGSPQSLLALRRASELARQDQSILEPIIAWHYPPAPHTFPIASWSPEEDAASTLKAILHEVFGDAIPDWVHPQIVGGPTANSLIEASDGADLLVVGSRGHGGFAGLLLGSVSSACAEYAHCPVLVMRAPRRD
jgi:nucleotide-binding universal stress UspA family protein